MTPTSEILTTKPEVFIGVDFGTKRLGIAVGQTITKTATALITLSVENGEPPWLQLDTIVAQWHPGAFVVGLPLNEDGSSHAITALAKDFGKTLAARYNLPIYFMDERLSSLEAQRLLQQSQAQVPKSDIDKIAAKLILESWLNQLV